MDGRAPARSSDGELEGLDESQRAEVHEYEGGGPSDGTVLTDMTRDRGEDYVEDDRDPELMSNDIDHLGLTILTPEDLGDDVIDDDGDTDDPHDVPEI